AGKLWWSGGGNGKLHTFHWSEGKFHSVVRGDTPAPKGRSARDPAVSAPPFLTGLFHDAKEKALYSLAILPRGVSKEFRIDDKTVEIKAAGYITRILTDEKGEELSAPCGKRPYDVLRAHNGLIYVSDWADRCVLVVDPETLRTIGKIPVGEHPN